MSYLKLRSLMPVATATLAFLWSANALSAAVVTYETRIDTAFSVSNTDLLQTHLASSSFVGSFDREGELGPSAFANGVFGVVGSLGAGGGNETAMADSANTATFQLDSGFGAGYNITFIDSYAGWDNFRGGQSYVVSYSTVSSPTTYVVLATAFDNAVTSGNTNTHVNISASTGFLATNVYSLRFQFGGDLTAGYAAYREIDVQGLAVAVPEPEPLALMLAGIGMVGFMARKGRRG